MTACIIMHNMIIEDERDVDATIQDHMEASTPQVEIIDENTRFQEFLARHRQIKDKDAHIALRNGHKKKAKKNGSVEFDRQLAVFRAVLNNSTAAEFRLDMTTAVRFKIMAWKTKRHKIRVGADVKVDNQGTKDYKKNIKVTSMAAPNKNYLIFD
ncbi:hypothetical protein Ddye_027287 [Dipteronia dyeriana]|uniref:Transposase n=1 Tax=Dipteronia dyeriana TaxID=168575 RepID=A0AAD9TP93_9ROSI|nr:hypothetical protein Ddye_027287 [Dipteronia dyeriana]